MSNISYIYKLVNSSTDDIYIDSVTLPTTLDQAFNSLKRSKHETKLSAFIAEIGSDKFSIEVIEEYKYTKNSDKCSRVMYWIKQLKPSFNVIITCRKPASVIAEEANRAEAKAILVKERNREAQKKFRESHSEQLKSKINCVICDEYLSLSNISRHTKTHKHLNKQSNEHHANNSETP